MRTAIFNNINREYLRELAPDFEEVTLDQDPNVALIRSEDWHEKPLPEYAIGRSGSGTDNIPIDRCSENGVVVFNAQGANANAVKELSIALAIIASRNFIAAMKFVAKLRKQVIEENLNAKTIKKIVEEQKAAFQGTEIAGKNVLIIGVGGKIGRREAHICNALGARVFGYDPYVKRETVKGVTFIDSLEGLRDFHYIMIHASYDDSNRHMINADVLQGVRSGVVIVNAARGELVDNHALIKALEGERVSVYISDLTAAPKLFHAQERFGEERVLLLPHILASTEEAQENVLSVVVKRLIEFWETGNIISSVNFPHLLQSQKGELRITVSNYDVPGMLGKIVSVIGKAGHNIGGKVHDTRKKTGVGYSIIDIDRPSDTEDVSTTVRRLQVLEGVTKVRAITLKQKRNPPS